MTDRKSIAIAAYDGVQMSAVLGLQDLFQVANARSLSLDGRQLDVRIVDPVLTDTGDAGPFSAIILPPNLSGERGRDDKTCLAWIRAQHTAGALVCSVCAGAFWLGHAGLLAGRPVTTHWALEQEFRQTFPRAQLLPEHILIDDNDIVTSGGLMAWLDLGLFLVERWLGGQVLSLTARHLLIDPKGRDQRNYRSFSPDLTHGDGAVLLIQHWMEGNTGADLSLSRMAQMCGTSERTFLRKFNAATGYSPNAYLRLLRIEKARGVLERTRLSVSEISWAVGYQDVSAFGRAFKAVTGLSPGDYRSRFSVLRQTRPG